MRKLPPLNAVRAFEVVARVGGISAATEELFVSRSAISRHISNLEKHLQTRLFLRRGKRLILTNTGREYLQQLEPALDAIAHASSRAMELHPDDTLTVSAPPSLLLHWLLPRLKSFLETYPDIQISWLDHLTFPEEANDIDCAIEYRIEPSSRLKTEPLLSDEIVAMAAPGYVSRMAIQSLEDVRGCTLIETERRLVSWDDVLKPFSWRAQPKRFRVALSMHALEAANLGYGIALANRLNASQAFQSGALCVPFTIAQQDLPKRPQYFISLPGRANPKPSVELFVRWLKSAAQ